MAEKLIPWPYDRVVAYKKEDADEQRLIDLRDKLIEAKELGKNEPLPDKGDWFWPLVTKIMFMRQPLCRHHWQNDWNLKDEKWGLCGINKRTGKQRQSVTLDTLTLARIVAEYKPSDGWELDEEPISRADFVREQRRSEIAKTFLAETLMESAEQEYSEEGCPDWHDEDKFGPYCDQLYQQALFYYDLVDQMLEEAPEEQLAYMMLRRDILLRAMRDMTRFGKPQGNYSEHEAERNRIADELRDREYMEKQYADVEKMNALIEEMNKARSGSQEE